MDSSMRTPSDTVWGQQYYHQCMRFHMLPRKPTTIIEMLLKAKDGRTIGLGQSHRLVFKIQDRLNTTGWCKTREPSKSIIWTGIGPRSWTNCARVQGCWLLTNLVMDKSWTFLIKSRSYVFFNSFCFILIFSELHHHILLSSKTKVKHLLKTKAKSWNWTFRIRLHKNRPSFEQLAFKKSSHFLSFHLSNVTGTKCKQLKAYSHPMQVSRPVTSM